MGLGNGKEAYMYDHILVPISFDDDRNVVAALKVATQLSTSKAKITLLHVMEQVPSYAINYIPEGFHEEAKVAIQASLEAMAEDVAGTNCVLVDGHSGRTILEWAEANDVACIVIASHRPGVQDIFLGSTASQVVRHANCAVHVIR